MRHILIISITLLFLTSPLTVQYMETGPQFQREVNGKSLCGDDEDDDSDEEEDCVEDADEDASEDADEDVMRMLMRMRMRTRTRMRMTKMWEKL